MASETTMRRRQFVKSAAIGAAAMALGPMTAAAAAEATAKPTGKRPPNILVIMSDEHSANVMGCAGDKIVQTPNLDGLARRGILFNAHYTNSPLCVPARLSFTSGKYINRVSAWNNSCWMPDDNMPSIAHTMNAAGYESVLCGKMHYDSTKRYGFQDPYKFGNGSYMTGKGTRRKADDLQPKPGYSQRFVECKVNEDPNARGFDNKVRNGVVDFLSKRKPTDKPFFFLAGFIAPHFPLVVPQKYYDLYQGKIPMPNIPQELLDSLPLNYKHLRIGFHNENVPPDVVRKTRELYYALVTWFDEQVGAVLKALEASGQAENTVVIYTSDHGENAGEHGLWWKNCVYDSAARVPLIISWPARWKGGQRRTLATSHVDLVKTIVELGGGKAPSDWNGNSMETWMDDPAAKWRDLAVSQYYAHNIASGYGMLRSGQYKYVYHCAPDATHPAERELYDLKADPGELRNLAKDSAQQERIKQMHAMLVAEVGEDPEATEQRCRAEYAKGYGREGEKRKKTKGGAKAKAGKEEKNSEAGD